MRRLVAAGVPRTPRAHDAPSTTPNYAVPGTLPALQMRETILVFIDQIAITPCTVSRGIEDERVRMLMPESNRSLGDAVGRYRLIGEIARGGMGIVYVAAAQ